jgi:hypothetical protein
MSPTTGAGKVTWSTCSAKNLQDFITKGSPEVNKKDLNAVPTCLTKTSTIKRQKVQFQGGKLPGEIYGLQMQCSYECGTKCVPRIKNQEVSPSNLIKTILEIKEKPNDKAIAFDRIELE